uniref:DNA repair protein XRCC3 n=1 Tax=Lygus hesperus TaxID=30085 RepID=A0A0A9XRX5_LYGHE
MNSRNKTDEIDVSQLDERLEREVEKAGMKNCIRILLADPSEFRKLGNFTKDDIELLKRLASGTILPNEFITASETTNVYAARWKKISLDCPVINTLLGGGIPSRGITELYGSSGAGKTQFCLQLAITVQYPEEHGGFASGCVYICTEDRFPTKRLQQLLPLFPRNRIFDLKKLEKAADNIFVDHIPDVESLNECLGKRLPILLRNHKIGLIILDSIAALFRSDYTNRQLVQRAKDLRTIGTQLHKLSATNNMAVLCVNQVTDSLDTNETLPALGLVWANMVTTKLQVKIVHPNRRQFSVVSSPDAPSGSCEYQITQRGIEGM